MLWTDRQTDRQSDGETELLYQYRASCVLTRDKNAHVAVHELPIFSRPQSFLPFHRTPCKCEFWRSSHWEQRSSRDTAVAGEWGHRASLLAAPL